jgi:hypothetical protein
MLAKMMAAQTRMEPSSMGFVFMCVFWGSDYPYAGRPLLHTLHIASSLLAGGGRRRTGRTLCPRPSWLGIDISVRCSLPPPYTTNPTGTL